MKGNGEIHGRYATTAERAWLGVPPNEQAVIVPSGTVMKPGSVIWLDGRHPPAGRIRFTYGDALPVPERRRRMAWTLHLGWPVNAAFVVLAVAALMLWIYRVLARERR